MLNDVHVFTDGSSYISNDTKYGGIGIFFSDNNPFNYSKGYEGARSTNQRMELLACIEAIIIISNNVQHDNTTIHTDSTYVINCMTLWSRKWIKNNWKRNNNKKICNLDEIQKLYELTNKYNVKYTHIRSHTKKIKKSSPQYNHWHGNYCADKLAKEAMNSMRQ